MEKIEDSIFGNNLPCNSFVMLDRLRELIIENHTNSLENCKSDPRVRRILWLLNSQVWGQLGNIDMPKRWVQLKIEYESNMVVV